MLIGVDIANYQGRPDFLTARSAGDRRFAVILATDGADFVSPLLDYQATAARAAGLLIGFYHYFRPGEDAPAQLKNFAAAVAPHWRAGDLICLDVEEDGRELPALVNLWVSAAETLYRVRVLLYLNRDFIDRYDWSGLAARCPLWLAAWQLDAAPAGYGPWGVVTLWQRTGGEHVPGIGWADGDEFAGEPADWLALGTPDGEAAQAAPAAPADGTGYTVAFNERGECVLTINFGGVGARVRGVAGDVGVSVANAAGERYHRTFRTDDAGAFAALAWEREA
jgi:GH25 family lysozyme M1 (1,4-beta-N-acetylmuramidase)